LEHLCVATGEPFFLCDRHSGYSITASCRGSENEQNMRRGPQRTLWLLAYHSSLGFDLLRCAKNLFSWAPFVRIDPDERFSKRAKTRAEGEEKQGQEE
jgi:hypothetical protein